MVLCRLHPSTLHPWSKPNLCEVLSRLGASTWPVGHGAGVDDGWMRKQKVGDKKMLEVRKAKVVLKLKPFMFETLDGLNHPHENIGGKSI